MEKKSVLKSKFFQCFFGIPSILWTLLSLTVMIPSESDIDPITWGELIIVDLFLVISWLLISLAIDFVVYSIKNCKNKKVDVQEMETTEKHPNYIIIKYGMSALFILTIASIWGGLYSVTIVDRIIPQYGFDFAKNTWVFWSWLPVPNLSIVLGFKYKKLGFKCKKNIVAGFIIGFLLLGYGSFWMIPTYSTDYNKIDPYKEIIDAKLPKDGILEIIDIGTYFDEDKTEYVLINVFYAEENVRELNQSIETGGNWIASKKIKSQLKLFIPSTFHSDEDAYYSIYNKTLDQYNVVPEISGDFEIYAMKYDKSDKQLEIHKFKITYIK